MDFETFSFRDFFDDLGSCLSWFKNIFTLDTPFFYNPLIFIIFGLAIIFFICEEIVGILTMFRFGGWFIRPFRSFFIRPAQPYETYYGTEFNNNYDKLEKPKKFYAMRSPKYFVSYKGKLYPVYNKRYLSKFQSSGYKVYSANALRSYNHNFSKSFSGSSGKGSSGMSKGSVGSYNVKTGFFEKLGAASLGVNKIGYAIGDSIADSIDDKKASDLAAQTDINTDALTDFMATSSDDEYLDNIIEQEYLAGLEAGEYD